MAFTSVNKSRMGGQGRTMEVRLGSRLQSGKGTTRQIYFSISGDVVQQVGWKNIEGIEDRMAVEVGILEGSGDDAGFLLLTQEAERKYIFSGGGKTTTRSITGSVVSKAFEFYELGYVLKDIQPESVEFTVDEKEHTILIQCPDWLVYRGHPELIEDGDPGTDEWIPNPKETVTEQIIREEREKINQETAIAVAHELLIDRPKRKQQVTVHPNYDEDAPDVVIAPGKDADLPAMNRSERRVLAKKVAQAMPRSRR